MQNTFLDLNQFTVLAATVEVPWASPDPAVNVPQLQLDPTFRDFLVQTVRPLAQNRLRIAIPVDIVDRMVLQASADLILLPNARPAAAVVHDDCLAICVDLFDGSTLISPGNVNALDQPWQAWADRKGEQQTMAGRPFPVSPDDVQIVVAVNAGILQRYATLDAKLQVEKALGDVGEDVRIDNLAVTLGRGEVGFTIAATAQAPDPLPAVSGSGLIAVIPMHDYIHLLRTDADFSSSGLVGLFDDATGLLTGILRSVLSSFVLEGIPPRQLHAAAATSRRRPARRRRAAGQREVRSEARGTRSRPELRADRDQRADVPRPVPVRPGARRPGWGAEHRGLGAAWARRDLPRLSRQQAPDHGQANGERPPLPGQPGLPAGCPHPRPEPPVHRGRPRRAQPDRCAPVALEPHERTLGHSDRPTGLQGLLAGRAGSASSTSTCGTAAFNAVGELNVRVEWYLPPHEPGRVVASDDVSVPIFDRFDRTKSFARWIQHIQIKMPVPDESGVVEMRFVEVSRRSAVHKIAITERCRFSDAGFEPRFGRQEELDALPPPDAPDLNSDLCEYCFPTG